ncbi:hypothetical protein CMU69_18240 [Elizabethkingia anophelis]|nr:hypothetical protein CQS02_02280 [Elizabethkingia miricola]MDV3561461.1 hypothetical protein [Elizabethkingia anophelis]
MQKKQDRLWIIQLEKFVYTKTHLATENRLLFCSSKKTNNQMKINKLNHIMRFSAIERKKVLNHETRT